MRTYYYTISGLLAFLFGFSGIHLKEPTVLTVECPQPITLTEGSKYDTTVTGLPKVLSNTGGKITMSYLEVYQKGDCKNKADLVTRIFTITNAAGDQQRCTQYITLQHLSINDIVFPADTTIDHPDSLSTLTQKLLKIPKTLGSIKINYFDTRVSQNCNIPVRIRRQWSLEDLCTGSIRTGTTFMNVHKYAFSFKQLISISDAVCEKEGFITLSPVGEFAPYKYKWSTGDSLNYLVNVGPGSYTLTVTDRFTCSVSVVYDLLSMAQRADIGGAIRTESGIRVLPDSIIFEKPDLIKKLCVSENAGLHYGFTLKNRTTGQYNYRFVKNTESREGISTKDIVLIQRHILGLDVFKDTLKNIAADVNQNFQITASDISEIRRVILGVKETFTSAKPWYFFRSDWRAVAKPNRPIGDIEFKGINIPNFPLTNVNVVAVKMGDIDFSFKGLKSDDLEVRTADSGIYLEWEEANDHWIPVFLNSKIELLGLQCAIGSDAGVEFKNNQLEDDYFHIGEGLVMISWSEGKNLQWDWTKPLFYIKTAAPEQLKFYNVLDAEAYDEQLNIQSVSLRKKENSAAARDRNWVYPNPARDFIKINSPQANTEVKIFSILGTLMGRYAASDSNTISLKDYENGMYLILLYRNNELQKSQLFLKN